MPARACAIRFVVGRCTARKAIKKGKYRGLWKSHCERDRNGSTPNGLRATTPRSPSPRWSTTPSSGRDGATRSAFRFVPIGIVRGGGNAGGRDCRPDANAEQALGSCVVVGDF